MTKTNNLKWLILTGIIIAADQYTKHLAVNYLDYLEPYRLLAFFNLTLSHNKGVAFSFLSQAGGWQRWLFMAIAIVVSTVIIFWLQRLKPNQKLTACALALILGGTLGNLWDRTMMGYVIDFLHFHIYDWSYPIFNVADSAICVGALMLIVDVFRKGDTPV